MNQFKPPRQYHPRLGVFPISAGGEKINLEIATIAEVFKSVGYSTAAYGINGVTEFNHLTTKFPGVLIFIFFPGFHQICIPLTKKLWKYFPPLDLLQNL
ncbi:hypothetical protein [Flagellimonas sp. CMM7]|uniref:hypothetical protein n=1 Tax=Flagellimonas sp. CMM7 TaxID=2654676 RepID=UPI0013D8497D|nr:hypothetical protein [Flagellimonas sp. CMM7]UII80365.1 hypothetical protein LV704_02355 [Flagellimonas sp. CMM7]